LVELPPGDFLTIGRYSFSFILCLAIASLIIPILSNRVINGSFMFKR